jgi:hypothetical protein
MYFTEFGQFIVQVSANDSIVRNDLLGPGVPNRWTPDSVWDMGCLDAYQSRLAPAVVVERYAVRPWPCSIL